MYPHIGNTPIDITLFHKCEAVMDVIYNPILTRFCLEAQNEGIKPVSYTHLPLDGYEHL